MEMTYSTHHNTYSTFNLIRACAAIVVLVGHVRNQFYVNFQTLEKPTILDKTAVFIGGLGHSAVIVFFVLSGFFISSSIFRMLEQNKWSWKKYLVARFSRLYTVLIPALMLTWLWDVLGHRMLGAEFNSSYLQNDQGSIFFGNLFFLQKIYCSGFRLKPALVELEL